MKKEVFRLDKNKRIDIYLCEIVDLSRSTIQKGIKEGKVLVNSKRVKKNFLLSKGDEISYDLSVEKKELKPSYYPIPILYEDEDLMVINKPRGLVVYPGNANEEESVVSALMYEGKKLYPEDRVRPGIVHRIDKDTTGLMIITKSRASYDVLKEEIKLHRIHREYKALLHGAVKNSSFIVDKPLGIDRNHPIRRAVREDGKHAKTYFEVIKRYKKYTLVKCILETGRTHQIRVHAKYIQHPVVGDRVYKFKNMPYSDIGQLLHSYTIKFNHPISGELICIESDLPDDFSEILRKIT